MEKYFVVHRRRRGIDIPYVKEFRRNTKGIKYHTSFKDASKELNNGFYDDSDYDVFSIDTKGKIKRHNR